MKKTFFGIAAILLGLCSCDQVGKLSDLSDEQQEELSNISFKYKIETWGTENGLEPGDRIGLFASSPIKVSNVLTTVEQDGTLKCSEPVKWNLSAKTMSVTFVGYAPYSTQFNSGSGKFSVQTDQSTQKAVKESDLMVATARISNRQNEITLGFTHAMVRVALYFDNRSGEKIESVTVSDVCADADFDGTTGSIQSTAFKNTSIKAGRFELSDNKSYYAVLIAPQTSKPAINVTLSNGQSRTFHLNSAVYFTSGKLWDNASDPLVIKDTEDEKKEEPAVFTLEVKDWYDGGSMYFSRR